MSLVIKDLTKQYNKSKIGLSNYSITIEKGVLGLLGPNGAGKSTLMKIVATISKPTAGKLFLDGEDIVKNPDTIRKVLGYLPQDFGVYPNLNAYEFLEYIAAMKGVGGKDLRKRIDGLKIKVIKTPSGSNVCRNDNKKYSRAVGMEHAPMGFTRITKQNKKINPLRD